MTAHIFNKYDLVLVKGLKHKGFSTSECKAIVTQPPKDVARVYVWFEGYDVATYCHGDQLELIKANAVELYQEWEKNLQQGHFVTYSEFSGSDKVN